MNQLACSACGNEEPEGARFCGNCGAPLVPAAEPGVPPDAGDEATLTCGACGNREPEGARFCGNCGAALAPSVAEPPLDEPSPSLEVEVEQASPIVAPATSPLRRNRHRPVAAGAVVALFVAGGVAAAFLLRSDGDGSNEVTPTAPSTQPVTTSEDAATSTGPTLAEGIAPSLQLLAASQSTLADRVRSLIAGVESFAALRDAAESVAASVVETQRVADGLAPSDPTEQETLARLRQALAAHLAYAEALSSFPSLPRSLTDGQARAAIARADEAERAYASVTAADSSLPAITVGSADSARLVAVVPVPKPTPKPSPPVRRTIDLVPLLVGIRPDDPVGEGRCFGPYTARASLRVSGVLHHTGFIQCGDDEGGDPSRTTGEFRFSGQAFPAGSRLARLTGQVAIDESSSPTQRGSRVTWTASYDGTPICSQTVVWSGSRPSPRALDCSIPASASTGGFDVRRLRIDQVASPASSGSLWAGLLRPTIVVEVPAAP